MIVICNNAAFSTEAERLAEKLSLPLENDLDPRLIDYETYALVFDDVGLGLQALGQKVPGIIRADFVSGSVNHRRQFGGGKGQLIAKAVGLKSAFRPFVLDATAGLGKDAFVLATLGCRVQMHERNPVVHALLEHGLKSARQAALELGDTELITALALMTLMPIDSLSYLQQDLAKGAEDTPDVIYLDPMFPERQKAASVKKEMKAFHEVVGEDNDAEQLLTLALANVNYRVLVKRPRKAPTIDQRTPSYQMEGKAARYDIYTLKKMP